MVDIFREEWIMVLLLQFIYVADSFFNSLFLRILSLLELLMERGWAKLQLIRIIC